jgi:hypothetical protein
MNIPTIGYSGTEERYAHTPKEKVMKFVYDDVKKGGNWY